VQFVFGGLSRILATEMMQALAVNGASPDTAKMPLHPMASIAMKRNTHALQVSEAVVRRLCVKV
jgi:hypothetical protein